MPFQKGHVKAGGRSKGATNKTTALLKDAILEAATAAGEGSLVQYLTAQAIASPAPFLALLGKVLPMTIAGDKDNPVKMTFEWLPPQPPAKPKG